MGFKCKNCGSNVKYDVKKVKLECESCGSTFEVQKYSSGDSNSSADYIFEVFHCKSCGAELLSLDEEQAAYCTYCGSQAFLSEKADTLERPKKIIPFKISKQVAKEKYQKEIEGQWFLPKEFKSDSFMEEFRGIYIPYWQSSVDIEEKSFDFDGVKSYTSGGFDYHEKYDMGVRFEGNIKTSSNDASIYFDDTIAESIAPFKLKDQVDFKEGYLAGFYADKANVSNDIYLDYNKDIAIKCLDKKLKSTTSVAINDESWKRKLKMQPKTDGISLFPVWFLTWRKNKRVAYSVVNGQTGKMITDLPVDYKEFFKYVGISTIILFLLLSILPIFVLPLRLAGCSGIMMWLTTYISYTGIKKIGLMESHKFDYGFTGKKRKKQHKGMLIVLRVIMWFLIFITACIAVYSEVPSDLSDVAVLILFMNILIEGLIAFQIFRLNNKIIIIPTMLGVIGSIVAYELAVLEDPHDYMNYIIAFIYLAIMVMNALVSMYYMNYLTTRPVPNFFSREGANHKYEAD